MPPKTKRAVGWKPPLKSRPQTVAIDPAGTELAIAYALGSISFAVVVSRAFALPDPRTFGSGNPGATNVLRSGNKLAAAMKSGVYIAACQNSMRGFKLETADLAPGVGVVPSGVVELIRRQHAGYAYVRS